MQIIHKTVAVQISSQHFICPNVSADDMTSYLGIFRGESTGKRKQVCRQVLLTFVHYRLFCIFTNTIWQVALYTTEDPSGQAA
jgi:hypothetical protein